VAAGEEARRCSGGQLGSVSAPQPSPCGSPSAPSTLNCLGGSAVRCRSGCRKDTEFMHFTAEGADTGSDQSLFVEQAQAWFDAMWAVVGREQQ